MRQATQTPHHQRDSSVAPQQGRATIRRDPRQGQRSLDGLVDVQRARTLLVGRHESLEPPRHVAKVLGLGEGLAQGGHDTLPALGFERIENDLKMEVDHGERMLDLVSDSRRDLACGPHGLDEEPVGFELRAGRVMVRDVALSEQVVSDDAGIVTQGREPHVDVVRGAVRPKLPRRGEERFVS